ncbi:MAG: isoleucine--tRNA ligase [Candidatus Bathyarchaeia archaeon]|nr:isoleucine--tRNA ligase [Candidatus Bathyarchaeota archaeon A05DMB-4]MDH7595824.1 isoleucine--tRNA ligase [Candidatus Bathyarchaeota archaeon]
MTAKFETDSRRWLTEDYRPLDLEKKVREFWKMNKTATKLMQQRENSNKGVLGYVEGPPTLNGLPHVGHARGRVMKDLRYRWKSMQGFYMNLWAGWDTQGLPVELEVERALGVKNKRELLEKVSLEKFVEECKKTVMKYYKEWRSADDKLGMFMDYDRAYWTYLDAYIEREWQYLKKAWEQGLLGEGYYVVAYCPHCQTSLSNAEVGLGYEEVEDPSTYFKFKVDGGKNEFFLVWTTMPFTLVTDMMLAVHPEAEYAKVKVGDEVWIMVSQRVEALMQELEVEKYEVLETVKGSELEGVKYSYPFMDLVPKQKELDKLPHVHTVVCEDFVDVLTATGIVHLAPGNGEDDFVAAQKREMEVYVPFDDECKFTKEAGAFDGLFARDADAKVVEELRKRGLLVSVKLVRHEYPTCWRSHHKLVWLARREYYLWTNKINKRVVSAAEKVEYFNESPKNRFLSFLKEGKPWCISRERVWGTPLPVWVCEKCGTKTLVASKKEMAEKSLEPLPKDFELHKPWIDRVVFKCDKCGGLMKREPFVLDCWFDSGASPYARYTDAEFEKFVPVDFLTEAIDQTRGWANSLLLLHVTLTEKAEAPYRAFLFQGHVLDAKGRKMSKSLKNMLEANPLLEKTSADVFRFYVLWKCSPVDSMNFDLQELSKRPYQVLSTLYHLHRFFMQNAEYDNFNPKTHSLEWAEKNKALRPVDRWLLSKLQGAVKRVTDRLDSCEFQLALSELEEFVVDVLSRDYVPMVRKDLWTDEPETLNRRLAVYSTLHYVLKTLVLLFNPATPFLCEALYQRVYRQLETSLPESVNFEGWPTPNDALEDKAVEQQFETLKQVVSLTYSARQSAKLKRRWPLRTVQVAAPKNVQKALKELEDLFLELANVKVVEYMDKLSTEDAKGWQVASDGDVHVRLSTVRDEALVGEGVMRDLSRRVQSLRKELGFSPTDMLETVHLAELDKETVKLLMPFLKEMAELVRAKRVQVHQKRDEVNAEWHEYPLDNAKMYVAITK